MNQTEDVLKVKNLVMIRDSVDADHSFIMASWLKGLRNMEMTGLNRSTKKSYFGVYQKKTIEAIT